MDIHFIIGDRAVTARNWQTFGPEVTRERLEHLADAIQEAAETLRCDAHRSDPVITARGDSLGTLTFDVSACCRTFEAALAAHLHRRVQPGRLLSAHPAQGTRVTLRHRLRRLNRAFGPVLAGVVIDSVDLVTFGPLKRFLGLPLGLLAGYWMGSALGLRRRGRWLCALASGIYCFIPGLEFIPLATLIGAVARYRKFGSEDGA